MSVNVNRFIQHPLLNKQTLRFSKVITNLPWLASDLSNPQSLTHSCGLWTNLVMCIWSGNAAWLHALKVTREHKSHNLVCQPHFRGLPLKLDCFYLTPRQLGWNLLLHSFAFNIAYTYNKLTKKVHLKQFFLRRFRDPIRVPRISNRVPRIRENYHRVPKIKEYRVPRIREIGSLQIHTGYLTFSLKKLFKI